MSSTRTDSLTERLTKLFNWLMTGPRTARPIPAEPQAAENQLGFGRNHRFHNAGCPGLHQV